MPDARDLLRSPFAFSQRHLLNPHKFSDASRDRGHWLTATSLEALHRNGVLVPLFRLRRPRWDINQRRNASTIGQFEITGRQWTVPATLEGLREDDDKSLLRTGRDSHFRPWNEDEVRLPMQRVRKVEYLYSPWQLLELEYAEEALAALGNPRSKWNRARLAALRRRARSADERVILLSAIEPFYYPGIVNRVTVGFADGSMEAWYAARDQFSALSVVDWMGWTSEKLYESARDLLWKASLIDPLRNWTDLINQIEPRLWERLKGDALLALEGRIAAEMILRLYESASASGMLPPLPEPPKHAQHELHWRVVQDRSRLDDLLAGFGLSPYPAVVLAVEGETEELMVPLVMAELGIPQRESFIRIVRMGGEASPADHRVLAEYVALPRIGPVEGNLAPFLRPPTVYFIAVDGDRQFSTQAARDAERTRWRDVLEGGLDQSLRGIPVVQSQLAELIRVEAWADGLDFERAHFTDEEIADALFQQGWVPAGTTRAAIVAELTRTRRQGESISRVWRTWSWKPPKPAVALALWPTLRRKMRRKRTRAGLDSIPVARVVLAARDIGRGTPRGHVVLRVR
jgi:hypothetical protein